MPQFSWKFNKITKILQFSQLFISHNPLDSLITLSTLSLSHRHLLSFSRQLENFWNYSHFNFTSFFDARSNSKAFFTVCCALSSALSTGDINPVVCTLGKCFYVLKWVTRGFFVMFKMHLHEEAFNRELLEEFKAHSQWRMSQFSTMRHRTTQKEMKNAENLSLWQWMEFFISILRLFLRS